MIPESDREKWMNERKVNFIYYVLFWDRYRPFHFSFAVHIVLFLIAGLYFFVYDLEYIR